LKDFYSYDPQSNIWTQIVSIGGTKRRGASSFVINDLAYIVCGQNNGEYIDDMWRYDPSDGTWTQMRDITDTSDDDYDDEYVSIIRAHANTFVIDNVAYLTCGENGSLMSYTWKYYPDTDLWEEVHSFKGSARTQAVSFSNGEKGFVATGKSGTSYFDDIWILRPYEYDPDDE
jgi:N-acetylneuraminic acid mutarotase